MITDEKGVVIPSDVTGLMEYVRNSRGNKHNPVSNGNTGVIENVLGSVSDNANQGTGTPHTDNGTDETIRDRTSGAYDGIVTDGTNQGRATGRGYSSDEHVTTVRKQSYTSRAADAIKSTLTPFADLVKQRQEKKKVDEKRKPKETEKRLSDTEAIRLRPRVVEFILWSSEHLDQFIQATTVGHEPVEIWSNIDTDEAEILADAWIRRGKTNPAMARVVRDMAVFIERIKEFIILTPRVYKTGLTYIQRGFSIR